MPQLNYHSKSSSSSFIPAFRPGLLLVIILTLGLVLTACGDQNTPEAAQAVPGVGGQVISSANGTNQGQEQGQSATTSAPKSSKTTPKPAATTAKVPADTVHICSLLTKDEAAASLGETNIVIDSSRDALGEFGDASCSYTDSTGGVTVEITIAGQAKVDFEKYFNNLNAQVVPGLGDAAFFLGGQLSTLKGKIGLVILLVNPAKGSETLNNEIGVTQKVLAALGKTSHASDLTASVPAPVGVGNKVTAAVLPVYPGSVLAQPVVLI